MNPDDILAHIDAAIDAWETGPDAMRRAPDGHVVERPSSLAKHLMAAVWRDGQRAVLDEFGHWTPIVGPVL